jgi:hypothetical protein
LTSNPQALKILQAIFAKPASAAAFQGVGEGVPTETEIFPESALASNREKSIRQDFSDGFPQPSSKFSSASLPIWL